MKYVDEYRDPALARTLLARIESVAQGDENLMPLFIEAVQIGATLGEICDVLRAVWGEYRPVTRI